MSNLFLLYRVLIIISLVTLVSDRGKRDPVAGQECSKATKSWIMQRWNTMSSQRISLAKLKSRSIVQHSILSVEVSSPKPNCNQLALQYSLSFGDTDIAGTCSDGDAQGACVCSVESTSRPKSCKFTVDCSRELRKASTGAHLENANIRTITISTEITGLRSDTTHSSYLQTHFSCSVYLINCSDYTLGDLRLQCSPTTRYEVTGCDCSPAPHTKRGAKRRKSWGVTLRAPADGWFESTESYLQAVHAHLGTHGDLRERDLVVLGRKNPVELIGDYLFGAREAYREALVEWVGQQDITCPEFEIPQCESETESPRQGKRKKGKGKGKSRKARKKGSKKG